MLKEFFWKQGPSWTPAFTFALLGSYAAKQSSVRVGLTWQRKWREIDMYLPHWSFSGLFGVIWTDRSDNWLFYRPLSFCGGFHNSLVCIEFRWEPQLSNYLPFFLWFMQFITFCILTRCHFHFHLLEKLQSTTFTFSCFNGCHLSPSLLFPNNALSPSCCKHFPRLVRF